MSDHPGIPVSYPGAHLAVAHDNGWELGKGADAVEWADPDDREELHCCPATTPENFTHTWFCTRVTGHGGWHVAGTRRNRAAAVWIES